MQTRCKAKDPAALRQWYRRHLGIGIEEWGGTVFNWASAENPAGVGSTVWSVFDDASTCFGPGANRFMINFGVDDLHALLAALRAEGCAVDQRVEESEVGKLGWIVDPEGHRIELWEPLAGR